MIVLTPGLCASEVDVNKDLSVGCHQTHCEKEDVVDQSGLRD